VVRLGTAPKALARTPMFTRAICELTHSTAASRPVAEAPGATSPPWGRGAGPLTDNLISAIRRRPEIMGQHRRRDSPALPMRASGALEFPRRSGKPSRSTTKPTVRAILPTQPRRRRPDRRLHQSATLCLQAVANEAFCSWRDGGLARASNSICAKSASERGRAAGGRPRGRR